MEFPTGSPIRIHTKDDRTFETDTYEWGELGVLFDFIQNFSNSRKRALIPWNNVLMIVMDLSDDSD